MRSSPSCLPWRRTTAPRRLPSPGSVDAACEAVLIRVPVSAPVCPKTAFAAALFGIYTGSVPGP
ncbi:MAG: hypothetical protein P8175_03235, partial [Deltaproteobacteria bacterium]